MSINNIIQIIIIWHFIITFLKRNWNASKRFIENAKHISESLYFFIPEKILKDLVTYDLKFFMRWMVEINIIFNYLNIGEASPAPYFLEKINHHEIEFLINILL